MKQFKVYWKDGESDIIKGKSFIGALCENFFNSDIIHNIEKWERVSA